MTHVNLRQGGRAIALVTSAALLASLAAATVAAPTAAAKDVTCMGKDVTKAKFVGTPGNDVILGTPGNDVIHGRGGNDRIFGLGGKDIICGGTGNDLIAGRQGHDILKGNAGNDRIYGGTGNDHMRGGIGNDRIFGRGGNDFIDGETGTDWCVQGVGSGQVLNCELPKANVEPKPEPEPEPEPTPDPKPVVTEGQPSMDVGAGVRYKGQSGGKEVYLGTDLGGAYPGKVEQEGPGTPAGWPADTYPVEFAFDKAENRVTTVVDGGSELVYDFDDGDKSAGCAISDWDTMGITVVDRLADSDVWLKDVSLKSGGDTHDLKMKFSGHQWNFWTVTNVDFTESFTVAGDLVVNGAWDGNENNKVEILVGCSK